MTFVRGDKQRTDRKTVITSSEFEGMLDHADQFKDNFLRLRTLTLLCLLRLTGKRRTELATLEVEGLKVENGFLNVTFTLEKKRKEVVLNKQSTKNIPLTDPLTVPILEYLEYLKGLIPSPKYLFPRTKTLWGEKIYIFRNEHLRGRQVFNLVRATSETVWPHLFRETVASDVIRGDPTLIGAFKVQRRLDLADYRTGFNYLRRFAGDIIDRELEAQGLVPT